MTTHVQELAPKPPDQEIDAAYKQAVERAIGRIPVKNGVVCIDSIWVETSLPYDILHRVLKREDLILPGNVERINTKSSVREPDDVPGTGTASTNDGERRSAKRRKRRKTRSKAKTGD